MKNQVTLIRAVGGEFLSRKFRSLAILFGAAALILATAMMWLTMIDAWWWLLAAPVIGLLVLGGLAILTAWWMLRFLRPKLTPPQATGTREFVDKLERIADHAQTPMPLILLRVARDMWRPRGTTFIQSVSTDSKTLSGDFMRLHRNFTGDERGRS